jgi:hypothetical protein
MAGIVTEDTRIINTTCAHCGWVFPQPDGFATVSRCDVCLADFAERFWRIMGTHTPITGGIRVPPSIAEAEIAMARSRNAQRNRDRRRKGR